MVMQYAVKTDTMCKYGGCKSPAVFEHIDLTSFNWKTHTVATVKLCSRHSEMAYYGTLDSNTGWTRREIK